MQDTIRLVDELKRRDEAAAAALAEVEEVQRETERTRSRAEELLAFRAALPAERDRLAAAIAVAAAAFEASVAARAALEQEVDDEQERVLLACRLDEERAVAAAQLERAHAAAAELERRAEQAVEEAAELERGAQRATVRLAALPRLSHDATAPAADGLVGVAAWGARVRAGLLLLHAQLVGERDAIIREANELGSAVIGEALAASSVTGVRERVAQALHRL
jgi:hypothetical protein